MKQYVSKFSGKELDERLTKVDNIPTKTSELNNDSGFISEVEADNKYTDKNKTDVLERDIKDLKDKIDVEIPTKISQLENDKNYITNLDIQNKADLENGKIIASQLPDYILGQVMFGGIIDSGQPTYMDVSTSADFRAKFNYAGEVKRITSSEYSLYNGVYFISGVDGYFLGNGINIGDWLISTGNSWKKVDNSDAVTSVAGLVGNVNASALASVLADITDSNALARKTDLPKKLSELEVDIEIGSASDWNASEGELGYIKNRTHYKKYSLIDDDRIVSMNDVCITINLDYIGAVALVENLLWSDNLVFYSDYNGQWDFDWDTEIFFTAEVNNNLLTISSDTDLNWSEWLYTRIMKVDVLCISEDYIPTSIREGAAKGATAIQSVKTINGQSLVGSGDITIESNIGVYGDGYIESEESDDGTYLTANVAENLDEVSARGQLVDAYDVKTYIDDNIGDTEYISVITDKTLTTPNAVGGIAKGTKVSDLEGKTFAEMFDDLLFPTVNPTFTAPSASIAFKNYSNTQEVGATGPTSANFTTGYNAGEIKLNGVKQANRGGTLNSSSSFIYVNGSASNKTLPTKVTLGSTTFKYRAAYNQGPQPKNNKGGNYDSPLAAGTVDSSAITLNGTYPWYASTSAATSTNPVVKQSLVAWNSTAGKMSTGQFTVQPSGTLPQVFKLPRKIDVLQLKNALNGNMENVEEINGVPKDYTESTETINIGGTNVTYYVYTYSGSTRGSVTLLAKF